MKKLTRYCGMIMLMLFFCGRLSANSKIDEFVKTLATHVENVNIKGYTDFTASKSTKIITGNEKTSEKLIQFVKVGYFQPIHENERLYCKLGGFTTSYKDAKKSDYFDSLENISAIAEVGYERQLFNKLVIDGRLRHTRPVFQTSNFKEKDATTISINLVTK